MTYAHTPVDLSSAAGLSAVQESMLKLEREAKHAHAIVDIHVVISQYGNGLVTGSELLSKIINIISRTLPLKEGDRDLLNGEVLTKETPEAFLARLNTSFDLSKPHNHIDKDGKVTRVKGLASVGGNLVDHQPPVYEEYPEDPSRMITDHDDQLEGGSSQP